MKKTISVLLSFLLLVFLSSCSKQEAKHDHAYSPPTCQAPRTCTICGATEGSPSLVHTYINNECSVCGLIQLTLDNYEDYLECKAHVRSGDYSGGWCTSLKCTFEAKGNSHFKYNDVVFVVRFTYYDHKGIMQYYKNQISTTLGNPITTEAVPKDQESCTLKLSLAGNGDTFCYLDTDKDDFDNLFERTFFEIISISGTVKEY